MTSMMLAWGVRPTIERWQAPDCFEHTAKRGLEERFNIVRNRDLWGGAAVVSGTRIPVFMIEDWFRETQDIRQIIACYPALTPADVHYALAYANLKRSGVQADRDRHEAALDEVFG